MRRALTRRAGMAIVALALAAAPAAVAKPMSNSAFRSLQQRFIQQRAQVTSNDDMASLGASTLASVSLADLRPSQLAWLRLHGVLRAKGADAVATALRVAEAWKDRDDAEGAAAAALVASCSITNDTTAEQDAGWTRAALTHPGLPEAVRSGDAALLCAVVTGLHPDVRAMLKEEIVGFGRLFDGADGKMAWRIDSVYEIVAASAPGADTGEIHKAMLGVVKRARNEAGRKQLMLAVDPRALDAAMQRLDEAPRVAALVGSPAPGLTFLWDNDPKRDLRSLGDLNGKVVVLDFWATWCGPCIASFPQVRALAEHYEGYAVEIVGVTSPQGYSIYPAGRGRIQAASERQEFQQMAEIIPLHDITWTVAFSREEVFNPDYGIHGIPHVVIIDSGGVLRHRGLHPGSDLQGKVDMINALLDEAGLERPAGPIKAPGRQG